jgi:uncharacterized protein YjbJ (UPF0337 family)
MKIVSIWKQATHALKLALAALVCITALSVGMVAPSFASEIRVTSTPHLAGIFGLDKETAGKAEELVGKAQVKTDRGKLEGTGKQVEGRAKYNVGRVEDAASRAVTQATGRAQEKRINTDNKLDKAKDAISDVANNAVDGAKDLIKK